jgi:hypothetical protein
VQVEVLRLVADRVDVGAGVLGGHDEPGRSGTRAARIGVVGVLVPAVQDEAVPGAVCGERRHPLEARLLQVDRAECGADVRKPSHGP